MEQRLSVVTLASRKLDRAVSFYEALGWEASFANEGVVFFELNGLVLGLYRRDLFAQEVGVPESELGSGGHALAYNVREREEVDTIVEQAREAGGTVLVEPVERDWGGYAGYIADPDGHRWEIAHNPAWPIDEDGNVHIP